MNLIVAYFSNVYTNLKSSGNYVEGPYIDNIYSTNLYTNVLNLRFSEGNYNSILCLYGSCKKPNLYPWCPEVWMVRRELLWRVL